jgi:hypothetical protein
MDYKALFGMIRLGNEAKDSQEARLSGNGVVDASEVKHSTSAALESEVTKKTPKTEARVTEMP